MESPTEHPVFHCPRACGKYFPPNHHCTVRNGIPEYTAEVGVRNIDCPVVKLEIKLGVNKLKNIGGVSFKVTLTFRK